MTLDEKYKTLLQLEKDGVLILEIYRSQYNECLLMERIDVFRVVNSTACFFVIEYKRNHKNKDNCSLFRFSNGCVVEKIKRSDGSAFSISYDPITPERFLELVPLPQRKKFLFNIDLFY